MARIFWDTNLFVYLFEEHPQWAPKVLEFRRGMLARGDQLFTSWLTVGEVLTKPRELGDEVLERSYLEFFRSGVVELIPFGEGAARRYAEIRSRVRVRPADAMQLACAASVGTDLFVTNDSRLSSLVLPGITFITGIDRTPY
ncbi:MAG: PIN domain-containing protein [Bryobacteraceae bacterium]|nr:PIN domain-containing protein [Bryobacteraceae bacterium]